MCTQKRRGAFEWWNLNPNLGHLLQGPAEKTVWFSRRLEVFYWALIYFWMLLIASFLMAPAVSSHARFNSMLVPWLRRACHKVYEQAATHFCPFRFAANDLLSHSWLHMPALLIHLFLSFLLFPCSAHLTQVVSTLCSQRLRYWPASQYSSETFWNCQATNQGNENQQIPTRTLSVCRRSQ